MRLSSRLVVAGVAVLSVASSAVLAGAGASRAAAAQASTPPPVPGSNSAAAHAPAPVRYEENVGQTDPKVRFLVHGGGQTLFLTPDETVMVVSRPAAASPAQSQPPATSRPVPASGDSAEAPVPVTGAVVRMRLHGANPAPRMTGVDPLPGVSNYLVGNDRSKWHSGVRSYAAVQYSGVYPGVDLRFHGGAGTPEYDFLLAPGASADAIALDLSGADAVSVNNAGDLVLSTAGGELRQRRPDIFQGDGANRQAVAGGYAVRSDGRIGFRIGAYDHSRPLDIDPALTYATYLGGGGGDINSDGFGAGLAVAVDASGSAYVTGRTTSPFFPTTTGSFQSGYPGTTDSASIFPPYTSSGYVTKLTPDGSGLVYSTYLGGSGPLNFGTRFFNNGDVGSGIAVDGGGHAFVVGTTASSDFPTTPGSFEPHCGATCGTFLDGVSTLGSTTFTSASAAFTAADHSTIVSSSLPASTSIASAGPAAEIPRAPTVPRSRCSRRAAQTRPPARRR